MPETIRRRPEGAGSDERPQNNIRFSEHERAALRAAMDAAGETNLTRFVRTKVLEAIGYQAPAAPKPEVPWEVGGDEASPTSSPREVEGNELALEAPDADAERDPKPAKSSPKKSPKRKAATPPPRSKRKTRTPAPSSAVGSGAGAAPSNVELHVLGELPGVALRTLGGLMHEAYRRVMKR